MEILQNLHKQMEDDLSPELQEVADINRKLKEGPDSEFKKKFMVYQWFNKVRFSGSKVRLPIFSFDDMVRSECISASLPQRIKSRLF